MKTKQIGNIGLGRAISHFTGLGYVVSLPLNDAQPYDLIVDDGLTLHKVSVKTTGRRGFKIRETGHGYTRPFDPTNADLLFLYRLGDKSYVMRTTDVTTRAEVTPKIAFEVEG